MGSWITPNKVTAIRVFLGCGAVGLYAAGARGGATATGVVALALTIVCVALDGVDGYLARRFNMATPLGAQLDIVGDRVIENVFFTYFAVCGQISLWVPVLFFVRGSLTDLLRGLAASRAPEAAGDVAAFRSNWLLTNRWSRKIVASRASRGAYAALKCVCFCALGIQWMLLHTQLTIAANQVAAVSFAVNILLAATVASCVLRALPVVWEGRRDFLAMARPAAGPVLQPAARVMRIPDRRAVAVR